MTQLDNLWRRGGHVRVGVHLFVLALIPMAAAVWIGVTEVRDITVARADAQVVESAVAEMVTLQTLRVTLADESYWSSALVGVSEMGVPNAVVRALTGIDLDAELETTQDLVDGLVAEAGLDEVRQVLDEIRSGDIDDLSALRDGYMELEELVAAANNEVLRTLRDRATRSSGDLGSRLQVFEAATFARQTVTAQVDAYFSSQVLPIDEISTPSLLLVEQRALYGLAMAEVDRLVEPDSAVAAALAALRADSDSAAFFEQVDGRVEFIVADGVAGSEPSLATIAADLEGVAGVFEAAAAASAGHLDLILAAADDLEAVSRELADEQASASRRVALTFLALGAASLLFAAILTRKIGRPLRDLAEGARAMRDGSAGVSIEPRGPGEVREATAALNDASRHLELVEKQALALARGELEHASLHAPVPGSIGASLQEAVTTLAASLSEREDFRQRLMHEASHDGLTQLSNRNASMAHLHQGLSRTRRTGTALAVLFIDLDGFKDVNDRHGHQAGDTVLRRVAQRLTDTVRDGDHVGRLGGDELVIIAEPIGGLREAQELATRLLAVVSEPIDLGAEEVRVAACIGVAVSEPHHTLADELIREADLAVYQAKGEGRGRIALWDEELKTRTNERAELEDALTAALESDELIVHYQPIVDAGSRSVTAFEALVRWERPGHGLVPPDLFIPFAERSGLIVDLDRWVLREVGRQIGVWNQDSATSGRSVAVNVSGRSLGSSTFVDDVVDALAAHDVDPSLVTVEVTESALLDDLGVAAHRLASLRTHGVRVAIDDYGTGYTSLAHLRSLPIDVLKIDRSFTSDEGAASLVKLIIDTGHLLGARIVSEGVETEEQAQRLLDLGSDEMQGWLFGRPQPPESPGPE
ncbi:MAG: putative bifunctional diguanylate cyclase/phosphodiesterase [Acidimicrobiales bacterium]